MPSYVYDGAAANRETKMTSAQYKAALKNLELTIVGAAPFLGISRRQSQRIAAGDSPVPDLIDKVLKLILNGKLRKEDLS